MLPCIYYQNQKKSKRGERMKGGIKPLNSDIFDDIFGLIYFLKRGKYIDEMSPLTKHFQSH